MFVRLHIYDISNDLVSDSSLSYIYIKYSDSSLFPFYRPATSNETIAVLNHHLMLSLGLLSAVILFCDSYISTCLTFLSYTDAFISTLFWILFHHCMTLHCKFFLTSTCIILIIQYMDYCFQTSLQKTVVMSSFQNTIIPSSSSSFIYWIKTCM